MVYLPTWMVDFEGKCIGENIPVPWILWLVAFTDECGVVVLVVEVKIMSEVASHGVVEKNKNAVVTFGGDHGSW